jgi:hypothetical protein
MKRLRTWERVGWSSRADRIAPVVVFELRHFLDFRRPVIFESEYL